MAKFPDLILEIDDRGTVKATVAQAKRFRKRALRGLEKSADKAAHEYRDEVRKRAEGRPGPRKVTGAYWNSIVVVSTKGIFGRSFTRQVKSEHPAAARLEYGFVGVDARGRHYNQPPYKHWGPAAEYMAGRWINDLGNKIPEWWGK